MSREPGTTPRRRVRSTNPGGGFGRPLSFASRTTSEPRVPHLFPLSSSARNRAGLRRGDVILMINNKSVSDVDDFEEIVEDLPNGKAVALRILRDGVANFVAYTPSSEE